MPDYLKEFLARVWSRAIVAAAQDDGGDRAREKRYRRAAFDLVASIQPKRTNEQRSQFLAGLRGLTATLDEGLALIGWPKDEHDAFFGKLIGRSLRLAQGGAGQRARLQHADAADRRRGTNAAACRRRGEGGGRPAAANEPSSRVSAAPKRNASASSMKTRSTGRARRERSGAAPDRGGLGRRVRRGTRSRPGDPASADGRVAAGCRTCARGCAADDPHDLGRSGRAGRGRSSARGPSAEPEEPTEGPQLRHHLQIGASYLLRLKEQWETVRLTHMNASRTFFLFGYGAEDRGTISMTARMLGKLCEARRLKALEDKPLIDRATERVRSQAAMPPPGPAARKQELSTA